MSASALYDVIMQVELSKEVIEVAQATSIAVVILLVLLYAQVTTTKCVRYVCVLIHYVVLSTSSCV
eukprot:m.21275 g.21275  ORF g.21275 m.21275 type:complete len:66 (-) comp8268_c0_seq3:708-905(-)